MKKILSLLPGLALLGVLLTSCGTPEYYQEQAVIRAREYLLEECRDLDVLQREYVKFNKPVIMSENLLGALPDTGYTPKSQLVQFCITWTIPGTKELYMVYGVSESNMFQWRPQRMIIKNFVEPDVVRDSAIKAARMFCYNTLSTMSQRDRNHVRFTEPKIIRTKFNLDFQQFNRTQLTPEELEVLSRRKQTSLVWELAEPNTVVVIAGLDHGDLKGWQAWSSLITSSAFLQEKSMTEAEITNENTPAKTPAPVSVAPAEPAAAGSLLGDKLKETVTGSTQEVKP